MTKQKYINFGIFLWLLIGLLGCKNSGRNKNCDTDKKPPNIIFIMSDDHAYQAISCYDSSLNQTPNIDRLAKEGVRFRNSFCTNSICGPSRAVLLTGKYSHINGHIDNNVTFDGSRQTFPKLLQKAGYQTAMIGKWHLRSDPTGFDYWNVLPGQGQYYNPDFIENGVRKQIMGYVTDITTDIALNWLENRDQKKPFCMLLHHKAPHRNWMPGPVHLNMYDTVDFPIPETFFDDYTSRGAAAQEQKMEIAEDFFISYDLKVPAQDNKLNKTQKQKTDSIYWQSTYGRLNKEQKAEWDKAYKLKNEQFLNANPEGEELAKWKYRRYIQDYLSCIASVDDNVGKLLDYIDKEGLSENTIVVYTSDQGFYLGEHGWFDKRFMYEQSLRMPLIIRYPKEIKPAVNESDMVLNLDFAPTFLDYAGIRIPEDIQGRSFRKILSSETPNDWREGVYYHYYEYPGPHAVKRHYGIRTKKYKLIHFYYDVDYWELYDLENDPQEINNLYNNPDYAEIKENLIQQLTKLRKEYKDNEDDQFLPQPNIVVDNMAKNCNVSLKYPYHKKYTGGSKNALTDGVRANNKGLASSGFDVWQGFEGDNLEAIIDLKQKKDLNSISCGFLKNINAWIFPPEKVSFFVSSDGKNYTKLTEIIKEKDDNKLSVTREVFKTEIHNQSAKYIKVLAENIGVCPDWHPGAGSKAWLFADEIMVE